MQFPDRILEKLKNLPEKPGVYLMRNRAGKVIYVGKAKSLRDRVRHYFQPATLRTVSAKIRGLIRSIEDFDVLPVANEAEAILTEGRLIKEYRPRYNTDFKDDKRFLMLAMDPTAPYPQLTVTRVKKHDHHEYFGPYASSNSAREAKDFLEKRYGLKQCKARRPGPEDHKHCMADILRFCSAPCQRRIDEGDYQARAAEALAFLRGERPVVLQELHAEMQKAAESLDFERAATLRDTVQMLRRTVRQRANGLKDFNVRRDEADRGLDELRKELRLPRPPRVIETFDISNISGTSAVASMVCSVDGTPCRNRYRRFRIKTVEGANDPAMMREAVTRRYRRLLDEKLPLPDLVVFDGGITQLRAGREALDSLGLQDLRGVGLAKRFEEIVWDVTNRSPPLRLPLDSPALRILQNIRDEAHRFALDYHRLIRARRIRESALDDIPGIGDARKMALLRHFGSVDRLRRATREQLQEVAGVGPELADLILGVLRPGAGS